MWDVTTRMTPPYLIHPTFVTVHLSFKSFSFLVKVTQAAWNVRTVAGRRPNRWEEPQACPNCLRGRWPQSKNITTCGLLLPGAQETSFRLRRAVDRCAPVVESSHTLWMLAVLSEQESEAG